MHHVPVMVEEVMKYLDVKEGGTYVDGTAGAGGHLQKIVERVGEKGTVIAIDQNKAAIDHLVRTYEGRQGIKVVRGNYTFIKTISDQFGVTGSVDGVLLDLGFSSDEIQEEGRGFSFNDTKSLDMRYGQGEHGEFLCDCHTGEVKSRKSESQSVALSSSKSYHNVVQRLPQDDTRLSAEEVVNSYRETDLADIFWKYGDETRSRFFAKKIVEYRRKKHIETAAELAFIIGNARPTFEGFQTLIRQTHPDVPNGESGSRPERRLARRADHDGGERFHAVPSRRINPATKVFMALRIFVNEEFENVSKGLRGVLDVLKSGGRCVALTFHSGEDRIVKQFIKEGSKQNIIQELTKHVIKPGREEVVRNRLSRSAKLRAFEKI